MAKIFLISKDTNIESLIKTNIEDLDCCTFNDLNTEWDFVSNIKEQKPDLIVIDSNFENFGNYLKLAKTSTIDDNNQIILIANNKIQKEYITYCDGLIQAPFDNDVLMTTIKSHLKIKKNFDKLIASNKDLSKSLYQINALYNTSSQFAGTLNKDELCNIMLEGLNRILSFDIATVLIFGADKSTVMHVNSLCEISKTLMHALKMRLTLKYNNVFEDEVIPFDVDFDKIKLIEKIKPSNNIYDLKILNYDTLFAPIKVGDNFFGVVEIIKKEPFTNEDVTCFQTIVHQVALPLRSATLYEEIKETNIKLEKLEKLKSEFVSIVSHELRTPLTPINNSLEIVLSGQAGEINNDIRNFVNMAKRNVSRLSNIIEDLLDLSRVQTGKLEYRFKKSLIKPSIDLVSETFEKTAQDKNISFEVNISEDLGEFYIDCQRIEQILSNIISNAIKFTSSGGFIKISAEKDTLPDDSFVDPVDIVGDKYLKISIEDSGVGIKEEDIGKIFDKFLQIESSLTRNIGGIGLGLAITKQLLDTHFGLVSVKSQKDKGSKFSIYIPNYTDSLVFRMDLAQAVLKNQNIDFIYIRQKENSDFVKNLKEKNILKRIQNSKEIVINKDNYEHYFVYLPKLEESAFNFMVNNIETEIKNIEASGQKCGILLETATKSQFKKIENLLKELIRGNDE
ncbi:MAG: hypothetical protein E7Z91_07260 [Cyanobacteria bacterium SIG30]|nr:hypothetical protein [Cyanobacteria bacterium SIG30]